MMLLRKQSQPHRFPNKTGKERSLRRTARCARVIPRIRSAHLGKGFSDPVASPTKAFSLWTPDQGVPPMDPDEGPCPIDPRKERSAPATPDQGVPPVDPDQPSADWMRLHPGWCLMTRANRSGSENRKRTKILSARVDAEES